MHILTAKKIFASLALLIYMPSEVAAEFKPQYFYKDWRLPPYKTAIVEKGSGNFKLLVHKTATDKNDMQAVIKAKNIITEKPVLSLILIDENNNIIFESYGGGASKTSLIKGWSMTKSMTSIALGQALCEGMIDSLGDKASKYSKTLQGTAYGDATLKELLMMASGGTRSKNEGMPIANMNYDFGVLHKRTLRSSLIEFGVDHPNPANKGSFTYKGLDTAAISILLSDINNSKFQQILSRNVWRKIGAEKNGEIVVDKNNDALPQSGFGATASDWARLAIYIRDSAKTNSCFGNFIKDATTRQISNRSDHATAFQGYGYQFWTNNKFIQTKSAWLNGYGGQRIGIDMKSGKIIVMLSYEMGAVLPVYKLFDEWTR